MKRILIAILLCGLVIGLVPRLLPVVLGFIYPQIQFRIPPDDQSRKIYLTIDDAPSSSTVDILTVLNRHRVPATIFVIGNRVQSLGGRLPICEEGIEFGNHLRTTAKCSSLSLSQFEADLNYTQQFIGSAVYFRPPSDFGTNEQLALVNRKGLKAIAGTVYPLDHAVDSAWIKSLLVHWLVIDGGIMIVHDGSDRGQRTAEFLDKIIPELKDAGYEFSRLPTLPPSSH